MPISVVYDLTDYAAVRAICIVLSLILAAVILATAIIGYIRSGRERMTTEEIDRAEYEALRDPSADTAASVSSSEDDEAGGESGK